MSAAKEVKPDRKYTRDHEWALKRNHEVLVGISAYAVEQLGDITLVNLDLEGGATVQAGRAFGTVESVKTLSDLLAPLTGRVARTNMPLTEHPEIVNRDPWEAGWMVAIEPTNLAVEWQALLSPEEYASYLAEQE